MLCFGCFVWVGFIWLWLLTVPLGDSGCLILFDRFVSVVWFDD